MNTPASVCLIVLLLCLTGCAIGGIVADAVVGGEREVEVQADYRGLDNKTVAVLVAADPNQLGRQYFGADRALQIDIGRKMKQSIPGIVLSDPNAVYEFQQNNPAWSVTPYDLLLKRLDVQRLVVVDIVHYRLREPGNSYTMQGLIEANVGVAEAERASSDLALSKRLTVEFPPDQMIEAPHDEQTVRLGLHKSFADKVAGIFYDHTVIVND